MNAKFSTFICVFFTDGKGADIRAKFVTSLEDHNIARWDAGKPAMPFSESLAKDVVYGLTLNGYAAANIPCLRQS